MNNLYVFAIGGSGERIMYSMLMMLAAGMPLDAQTIIPVFVDNDVNSKALDKCNKLLEYYRGSGKTDEIGMHELYEGGLIGKNSPSFAQTNIGDPCLLNIAGDKIGTLKDIIGDIDTHNALDNAIAEERDLLFTKDDLEMPLSVGFVGNPNVGTVVLNSLSLQDTKFTDILGNVDSNDGVIVLGSLFGGTGAAGFPLIINKFYNKFGNNGQCPLLGGVAVLPYFMLDGDDKTKGFLDTERWDVNSETFDAKTRAALMYYADYMKQMDYRYYVGDDNRRQYDHYVGGEQQDNPVNMIEVMAALSVFDFAKQTKPSNIVYKRPQWGFDNEKGQRSNVSGILNKDLQKALVKFQMLKVLFYKDFLKNDITESRSHVTNIGIKPEYIDACINENRIVNYKSAWGLCHIFSEWEKWISDLEDTNAKRQLKLFNNGQAVDTKNITQLFYTDNMFGIAQTLTRQTGIITKKEEKYPADPDIVDKLDKSYKKLYPKGKKTDATNIPDGQRLGKLLQIISEALDMVLQDNCAL